MSVVSRASGSPQTSRAVLAIVLLGLAATTAQACSAGAENTESAAASTSTSAMSGTGGGLGFGGNGAASTSSAGGGESCAETEAEATEGLAPADIVIAVDTSGSMSEEAEFTQKAMPEMVTTIVQSGVDAHVVMISGSAICVPAPLGSGSCPNDEQLPAYRHVQEDVGSHNALAKIIATHASWKPSLRPNATKTFVVISDDDSTSLSAGEFTAQLLALDPSFQGFKFHAIVAPTFNLNDFAACNLALSCGGIACCGSSGSFPPCTYLSAAEGLVYKQLVQQTGGVLGDLCKQQFQPVFQEMATAVVADAKVPCVYDIPTPGGGQEIDYGKVNVAYVPAPNAPPTDILNVPGGAANCGATGGWYYDDPTAPTQILLCEATCTSVQAADQGKVSVKFGCATKIN